jgi:Protein of unknown function (DUF982)
MPDSISTHPALGCWFEFPALHAGQDGRCNQIGRSALAAMMDNKPFEKPVTVELGHVGKYRQIRTTQEAAECLMTVWPLNRGPRHRDALDTCLKVLEGYRSTADARRALIEAARESDVLVPDDRLPKHRPPDDRPH